MHGHRRKGSDVSSVTKRTVTTTRHEYVVPAPTALGACVSDVQKAIDWALQDMPEARRSYSDACRVEARDDEIVIWWPAKEATEATP